MARQFKIEITYSDGSHADIYWHNNADIEIISLPPIVTEAREIARLQLWRALSDYAISNAVSKLECLKLP